MATNKAELIEELKDERVILSGYVEARFDTVGDEGQELCLFVGDMEVDDFIALSLPEVKTLLEFLRLHEADLETLLEMT